MSLLDLKKKLGTVKASKIKIPPGMYLAILKAIEETKVADGFAIKFRVRIREPKQYEGQTITGLADPDMRAGSKFMEWLEAFRGGKTFNVGEGPDLESYIGKLAIVEVKLTDKEYEGQPVYSNIVRILPEGTPGEIGPYTKQ